MRSVGGLSDAVRAVMELLAAARDTLVGVATPIEDAGRTYVRLGEGSGQPELPTSAACLRAAYEHCRQAVAMLDQATDRLQSYLRSIEGPTPAQEQMEKLRRELPPPITDAERGSGRKTHGRWVSADGTVRPVTSGEDSLSKAALAWLSEHGLRPASAKHAEMKVAYYLRMVAERSGRPQHATIVVNNRVCIGPFGCATLLPVMLPAGCTLTVYAPSYRRTFTGGVNP